MRRWTWVGVLVGLGWPGAAAASSIEAVRMHVARGFSLGGTTGVIVTLAGDDGDETVNVELRRQGETEYVATPPAVRFDRHSLATIAVTDYVGWRYDVRVTLADPDGVEGEAVWTGVIDPEVRPTEPTPPFGAYHFVVAKDGTDTDSISAGPFATVAHVLTMARPGDTITVREGVWGPLDLTGLEGAADRPYILRADTAGGPVIIDGQGSGVAVDLAGSSHVWLTGFEIANGGDDATGIGVRVHSASHIGIRDCYIHDNGHYEILITKSDEFPGGALAGGHHLVYRNVIADTELATCAGPSNVACPGQTYYGVQLDNNPGGENVIIYNEIRNHVDNVSLCGDEGAARDLPEDAVVLALTGGADNQGWTNYGTALISNAISVARDDNVEADGICVNAVIAANRIAGGTNPISVAPALPGPIWFVRNYVYGEWGEGAVKLNTNGTAASLTRNLFFFHNTFVREATGPLLNLWYAVPGEHDVPIHNVVFRNNLFYGRYGGTAISAFNEGVEHPSFDYDLWYVETDGALFQWWNGAAVDDYASFDEFRVGTGQEPNGLFEFPQVFGGEPSPDSPVIDRAVRIPGINDAFTGAAPDIGAREYFEEPPWDEDAGGWDADPDAGVADGGSGGGGGGGGGADGGGCGCRVQSRQPPGAALSLLVFLAWRARRRACRRGPSRGAGCDRRGGSRAPTRR